MNEGTRMTRAGAFDHLRSAPLSAVVDDYLKRFRARPAHHDPVIAYCVEARPHFTLCIARAVASKRPDGKTFSQGSCVRRESKEEMTRQLMENRARLKRSRSFEDIYSIVKSAAPWGIGNMTIYNVSCRIAAYLSIAPRDYVYIHAGPLAGWRALTGHRGAIHRVAAAELPAALQRLPPHRIEDLLCEYRELLHPGMLR
jgi:hypothetical protein